jgi:hypothetical protein
MRLLLEGLNTWSRQWSETITIQDNGSLEGLENEVSMFKYLQHRVVNRWEDPNIVIAFMDRPHHNRSTEQTLREATEAGRPAFVISSVDLAPVEG